MKKFLLLSWMAVFAIFAFQKVAAEPTKVTYAKNSMVAYADANWITPAPDAKVQAMDNTFTTSGYAKDVFVTKFNGVNTTIGDPAAIKKIKAWQVKNGLVPDGIIGGASEAKMKANIANKAKTAFNDCSPGKSAICSTNFMSKNNEVNNSLIAPVSYPDSPDVEFIATGTC